MNLKLIKQAVHLYRTNFFYLCGIANIGVLSLLYRYCVNQRLHFNFKPLDLAVLFLIGSWVNAMLLNTIADIFKGHPGERRLVWFVPKRIFWEFIKARLIFFSITISGFLPYWIFAKLTLKAISSFSLVPVLKNLILYLPTVGLAYLFFSSGVILIPAVVLFENKSSQAAMTKVLVLMAEFRKQIMPLMLILFLLFSSLLATRILVWFDTNVKLLFVTYLYNIFIIPVLNIGVVLLYQQLVEAERSRDFDVHSEKAIHRI